MRRQMRVTGILGALLFLWGCSGKPPVLLESYHEQGWFLDRDDDTVRAFLSVFARATDEDGFADIKLLHVIHDSSMLYWSVDEQSRQIYREGDSQWLGAARLMLPAAQKSFPSGDYRLVVEDASGSIDETSFFLKWAPLPDRQDFPVLTYDSGDYIFPADSELRIYDDKGHQLKVVTESPLKRDKLPGNASEFYTADVSGQVTLITGPFHRSQEDNDRSN